MILSGGFKVCPTRGEEVLRQIPSIKDVAVVGLPVADGREDLTAAPVLEEEHSTMTLNQVRDWVKGRLPHRALPLRIVFLTELPRNPTGKVARGIVRAQLLDPTSKARESASTTLAGVVEHTNNRIEATENAGMGGPDGCPSEAED